MPSSSLERSFLVLDVDRYCTSRIEAKCWSFVFPSDFLRREYLVNPHKASLGIVVLNVIALSVKTFCLFSMNVISKVCM